MKGSEDLSEMEEKFFKERSPSGVLFCFSRRFLHFFSRLRFLLRDQAYLLLNAPPQIPTFCKYPKLKFSPFLFLFLLFP